MNKVLLTVVCGYIIAILTWDALIALGSVWSALREVTGWLPDTSVPLMAFLNATALVCLLVVVLVLDRKKPAPRA